MAGGMWISISILVFGYIAIANGQTTTSSYNCWPACTIANPTCPDNSACVDVSPPWAAGTHDYRCVCVTNYSPNCTSDGTTTNLTCDYAPTDLNCGFASGCPENSFCLQNIITREYSCACTTPGYTVQLVTVQDAPNNSTGNETTGNSTSSSYSCVETCNSTNNEEWQVSTHSCVCASNYARELSTGYCVQSSSLPCSSILCNSGYSCSFASSTSTCVANNTVVRRCGFDFQCGHSDKMRCIDSPTGPFCGCNDDTYTGPLCKHRPCWELSTDGGVTYELGCWSTNSYAHCTMDNTLRPYCSCEPGWDGDNCDTADYNCLDYYLPNNICNNPYDSCYDGYCNCEPSYIPVTPNIWQGDTNCSPTDATACLNYTCYGNSECVDATDGSGVQCQCPFLEFGRTRCDRPVCTVDADCTAGGLVNAMCVTATWYYVPNFCDCQYGFTGDLCDTPSTCPNCGTYGACTNQGLCVCGPGYYGDYEFGNCTKYGDPSQYCSSFDVIIGNVSLSLSAVQGALVNMAKLDRSVLTLTGPTTTAYGHNQFVLTICDSDDIDHEQAGVLLLGLLHNNTVPSLDYYFTDGGSLVKSPASLLLPTSSLYLFFLLSLLLFIFFH